MQRWNKVYDAARYLETEYAYKAKDFGLAWRKAYKEEHNKIIGSV